LPLIARITRSSLACVAVITVGLPLLVAGARTQPASTSVDSLVNRPQVYDRKCVRVRAFVRTDYRHSVVLLDTESSDYGVALLIPDEIRNDVAVAGLMRDIYRRPAAGKRRRIRAIFVGRFQWHRDEVPARVLSL